MAAGPAREAVRETTLVGCGWTDDDHALRLVDPETGGELGEGEVGEIWVAGPSVAQGYWRNPEATAATFVEADGPALAAYRVTWASPRAGICTLPAGRRT